MPATAAGGTLAGPAIPDDYARRLGALLRRRRHRRSMSARMLARTSGSGLSAGDLRAYERGQRPVDPATLQRLCDLYGVEVESLLPEHRGIILDFDRRELVVGGDTFALPETDDPAPALERYVRAVNRLRSRPMRSPATLRRDDTEALAEALELDADEVADLLADIIGADAAARRRATAVRSGAGTLAAVVVIGAASPAVQSRDSRGDAITLTAEEVEPAGSQSGGAVGAPLAVPPSATVRGPDLTPEPPPASSADEATDAPPDDRGRSGDAPGRGGDDGDDGIVDETGIGEPLVIERDPGDEGDADGDEEAEEDGADDEADAEIIDETGLADPVTIEREPGD